LFGRAIMLTCVYFFSSKVLASINMSEEFVGENFGCIKFRGLLLKLEVGLGSCRAGTV
jgi:hypothetical protein